MHSTIGFCSVLRTETLGDFSREKAQKILFDRNGQASVMALAKFKKFTRAV
jgi:hypothetical protein